MANEVVIINGVTKRKKDGDFTYDFPKAIISVRTVQDTFTVTLINNTGNPITTKFNDITDKLGQATLEEYVDFLAQERYYFEVDPAGTGITSELWIIVQTVDDLPDPVAGVITLVQPDTIYLFVGTVDLGSDRIVIAADNVSLRGLARNVDGIVSTTTADLITATSVNITIRALTVTGLSAATLRRKGCESYRPMLKSRLKGPKALA